MIILEGSDCTGKTTFAKKLVSASLATIGRELPYRHMSRPPDDFDHLHGYLPSCPAVQDRWHLGSMVYGMMLSKGSFPTWRQLLNIHKTLIYQGAVIIVMYHSNSAAYRKLLVSQDRAEMYNLEDIMAANDGFRMLPTLLPGILSWDISEKGFPEANDVQMTLRQWRTCT